MALRSKPNWHPSNCEWPQFWWKLFDSNNEERWSEIHPKCSGKRLHISAYCSSESGKMNRSSWSLKEFDALWPCTVEVVLVT